MTDLEQQAREWIGDGIIPNEAAVESLTALLRTVRNAGLEEAAQVCNADPAFAFIANNMDKHVNSKGNIDTEWQEVMIIPGRIREAIRQLKSKEPNG